MPVSAFKECRLQFSPGGAAIAAEPGNSKQLAKPVNSWLNRYQQEGIAGLKTKPGRGRKPVFEPARDLEQVRQAVVEQRQRLGQAKRLLEQQLGKKFSLKTLKRFLKKLSAATNGYGRA